MGQVINLNKKLWYYFSEFRISVLFFILLLDFGATVRWRCFLGWLLLNLLLSRHLVLNKVWSTLTNLRLVLREPTVGQILRYVELPVIVGVGDTFRPVVFSLKILLDDTALRYVTSRAISSCKALWCPRIHVKLSDFAHDCTHILPHGILHS
jgi:hypothetical protein